MHNFSKLILSVGLLSGLQSFAAFRGVACLNDYTSSDGSRTELELVEQSDGSQTLKVITTVGNRGGGGKPHSLEVTGMECQNSEVEPMVLYCGNKSSAFQVKLAQSRLGTTVYEAVLTVKGFETLNESFQIKKPAGPVTSYCKLK